MSMEETKKFLYEKTKYQKRALLYKNITQVSRQMSSNLSSILVPIFGLLLMVFVREALMQNTQSITNADINLPIPFFHNIPLKAFTSLKSVIHINDCNQWYLVNFAPNASQADRDFVGFNTGVPMQRPNASGLLSDGIMQMACKDIERAAPYFE